MRWMLFVLIGIFVFGFVGATQAEVVLIDDMGSFSGAVLKFKTSADGELSEKIYPKEFMVNVGIVEFDIETSADEVFLKFILVKNGATVDEFEEGPFVVNGSEILVDRREKAESANLIKDVPVADNSSEEKNVSTEIGESSNVSETEGVEVVIEGDSFGRKLENLFLTGKAVFVEDDGSFNLGFSLGGVVFILFLGSFIFMMTKRGRKTKKDVLDGDDREIEYMEKKVRDAEKEISRIEKEKSKKAKKERLKSKLALDEKRLRDLEEEELKNSEVIEDL